MQERKISKEKSSMGSAQAREWRSQGLKYHQKNSSLFRKITKMVNYVQLVPIDTKSHFSSFYW